MLFEEYLERNVTISRLVVNMIGQGHLCLTERQPPEKLVLFIISFGDNLASSADDVINNCLVRPFSWSCPPLVGNTGPGAHVEGEAEVAVNLLLPLVGGEAGWIHVSLPHLKVDCWSCDLGLYLIPVDDSSGKIETNQ